MEVFMCVYVYMCIYVHLRGGQKSMLNVFSITLNCISFETASFGEPGAHLFDSAVGQ